MNYSKKFLLKKLYSNINEITYFFLCCSLTKNDLIEVLSMDYVISGDEGWWTGKCNGKVGVFPCNFVAPADLDFSNLKREELLRFYPPHISFAELKIAECIGVGGFGKVFRGYYKGK